MSRTFWRWGAALLVSMGLAAALPAGASARSAFCSPSGDVCYGAFGRGVQVRLKITTFARYFSRYRLCVTAPSGRTDCRRFGMFSVGHGMYGSTVTWAKHFSFRGAGTYHARWGWGSGLGPRIAFAEGPSIHVRPARVRAGRSVRVFGLAGGCPSVNSVTLMSKAFPRAHEFAGIPAVFARVDHHDGYSTRVRIPRTRQARAYRITARCGGANFGAQAVLRVL